MTIMQKIILIFIAVVLAAASFLLIERKDQEILLIPTDEKLTTLYVRDIPLLVEIADMQFTRQLGLSGKPLLPRGEGMLFIFNTDDVHGFWMKDMLFDIDIICIDSSFNIVDIKSDATPESFPDIFKPIKKSRYVLEVNAGFVEEHSIKIGDYIRFDTSP